MFKNLELLMNGMHARRMHVDIPSKEFEDRAIGLKTINRKIFLIILFNIIDGILTYVGVINNYTVETNKIMVNVVSHFERLMLFKLFLPTLVLLAIAFIMNKYKYTKMPVACFFVSICFWVYCFVLLTHVVWIGMLTYSVLVLK